MPKYNRIEIIIRLVIFDEYWRCVSHITDDMMKTGEGQKMNAEQMTISEITAMAASGDMRDFYNSRAWRNLSHKVIKAGNGECCMCRQLGKVTAATLTHHVNELKARPDLAYSLTYVDEHGMEKPQLIPLCHDCHDKIHERGIYAVPDKAKENKFWQEELW